MTIRETGERYRNDLYDYNGTDCIHQKIADEHELAQAWVADNPADDETPIDEAWLRSVGFAPAGIADTLRLRIGPFGNLYLDVIDYKEGLLPSLWLQDEEISMHPTRGEVRRLIAATLTPAAAGEVE